MRCKGCNSLLREIQYQSRSADEPQTIAHCCPQCPLRIDNFFNNRKKPHLYLPRQKKTVRSTPYMGDVVLDRFSILRVTTRTSLAIPKHSFPAKASNYLSNDFKLFKVYSSGPWKGLGLSKTKSKRLTLNAEIVTFDVVRSSLDPVNEYNDFEFTEFEDATITIEGKDKVFISVLHSDSDEDILFQLSVAYSLGFVPDQLPVYVSRVLLGSMSSMNARAYDAFTAMDDEHVFSTKPDGERMWLVRSGSVWFYCRRLLDFKIEGWTINDQLCYIDNKLIGPVIDTEIMLGLPPILIDILADSQMSLSPYDRNVEWIYNKMHELNDVFPILRHIHMRKFFNKFADAETYAETVPYPIDGLVAISIYSTDMKKLKPTKSIELAMSDNGYLVSKEGTPLMKISNDKLYTKGSIIEIRFSLNKDSFIVHDHFERFDKRSANADSAISSILASYMEPESDSLIRTSLWRWSNKIRFYLYEKAFSTNPERNIVIDVGSGTGQSSEAFEKMPNCSFILVEPDAHKCSLLAKRLGVRKVHKNPRSIIPEISSLRRGSTRYHIINSSLQELLSDKACVNNVKGTVKCAIACFSTQYIVDQLDILSAIGIPFVGCYYSYNDILVNESIIDHAGIQMKRITQCTATVRWGSDKSYEEPVVEDDDLPFTTSQVSATSIVPAPTMDIGGPVQNMCSHLKILVSK